MKLLLDTHVMLWAMTDDDRLSPAARDMLQAADAVYISAASLWEIAIKAGLGKIQIEVLSWPGSFIWRDFKSFLSLGNTA